MILGKLLKTPAERKRYSVDYSVWLSDGETVTNVAFAVSQDPTLETPVSPLDVDAYSIASPTVVFFVSDGDNNASYSVDIQITTSTGQIKEDTVKFAVRAPSSP